jgi:Holliday junction DNA helicase RuvB
MGRPAFQFRDFVGHRKIVKRLLRQLEGAKTLGKPFPHCVIIGPSGVGKTRLAESLAREFGTMMHFVHGYSSIADLASVFTNAKYGDFVFVDEAHNLIAKAQQMLYVVIDSCQLPEWTKSESPNDEEHPRTDHLESCSIMLATDRPGHLLNALLKRAELRINLDFYTTSELKQIVDRLAADMGLLLTPQAANQIAKVSRGLPRQVHQHLQSLHRYFADAALTKLGLDEIHGFLRDSGIDKLGLEKTDRKYLRYLQDRKMVSVESLAIYLGLDPDYVRRQIEPQLLCAGLTTIGPGGRKLTQLGEVHLGKQASEKI